jgi:hypothetical protein
MYDQCLRGVVHVENHIATESIRKNTELLKGTPDLRGIPKPIHAKARNVIKVLGALNTERMSEANHPERSRILELVIPTHYRGNDSLGEGFLKFTY